MAPIAKPAPLQRNYTLDRGEEQAENVMAAGRANLQQSVWAILCGLAALSFLHVTAGSIIYQLIVHLHVHEFCFTSVSRLRMCQF